MAQNDFVDTDLLDEDSKISSTGDGRTTVLRTKFTSKEEEARKKLDEIRQQMEALERQRLENAELTRRLEEFDRNKTEAKHQFERIIASLEKHELEIGRQLATVSSVKKALEEHLGNLDDIREESWTSDDVKQNLQDAQETLEEAKLELSRGRQQLAFLETVDLEEVTPQESISRSNGPANFEMSQFKTEFLRGLAWTLPLIITAGVLALIALLRG